MQTTTARPAKYSVFLNGMLMVGGLTEAQAIHASDRYAEMGTVKIENERAARAARAARMREINAEIAAEKATRMQEISAKIDAETAAQAAAKNADLRARNADLRVRLSRLMATKD